MIHNRGDNCHKLKIQGTKGDGCVATVGYNVAHVVAVSTLYWWFPLAELALPSGPHCIDSPTLA
jgi:hypothetical protein